MKPCFKKGQDRDTEDIFEKATCLVVDPEMEQIPLGS